MSFPTKYSPSQFKIARKRFIPSESIHLEYSSQKKKKEEARSL